MRETRRQLLYLNIIFFCFSVFCPLSDVYAEKLGEVAVSINDNEGVLALRQHHGRLDVYVLNDNDDILRQIESLREQSKAELEPVVKRYMYTVEALTQLASQKRKNSAPEKDRLLDTFKADEKQIDAILDRYKKRIDARIQRDILQTLQTEFPVSEPLCFKGLQPGKYRVYGELTFATTILRWFEPLIIKGGDSYTVILTRENLQNPYWTELNWWSFMNLDFSTHH